MIMHSEPVSARISALREELAALEKSVRPRVSSRSQGKVINTRRAKPAVRKQNRLGRVTLAPGVCTTTIPGSMYSAMLKVLAAGGDLARHEQLFQSFARQATPQTALKLLRQIGVIRADLETRVRADEDFQDHCARRTMLYKNRAARGDLKAKGILQNRAICDARGRWIGDLEEGISILRGGRSEQQVHHGKNVRILDRAHLMFDDLALDGEQRCFLYRQKHHRLFAKACALAER